MADLKILGPVELRNAGGYLEHSFLAGSKRLALLTYLIINRPRGLQRRDKVLPLLWPEKGQKSARNSLSNMLYQIRTTLGSDVIITRGTEELGINFKNIQCDAIVFEKLIESGGMTEGVELYRGNLLEGLHVNDASSDFNTWLEQERERYRELYVKALETLASSAEKKGNLDEAVEWRKLQSKNSPYDTKAVKSLSVILAAKGNRAEALQVIKKHALFLNKELEVNHEKLVSELKENLNNVSEQPLDSGFDIQKPLELLDFKSIAILPFEEFGDNGEKSSFSGGLHNDLLTRLSGISSLNVISRTSVLKYRNTQKSIKKIARELGAGSVIEGSIQFKSSRLRLNIQLIDVKEDKHIWAETYDREFTAEHFFDIQSELALKITGSLKARLTPSERKRITEWAPTDDLEAHRLYTYGRKQLDQRTATAMQRAVDYFRGAVEQDPEFALAWVGLADALALQYDYGHAEAEDTLPRAEEAIKKALKIDSNLAEAYASLGLLYSNRHRGSAAIRELKRAVELQPSYAEAHNWLSWNYQLLGQPVKALESAKKAVNLNPLSPEAVSNLSVSYLYNGYSEKALSEALRGVELQPDWGTTTFYHGLALFDLKRYSEAKLVLEDQAALWAGNGPLATLALCHVMLGEKSVAESIKKELEEDEDIFAVGLIEASLKNKSKALDIFEQIEYWDDWETLSIHHLYTDILSPLKRDPRFKGILESVNHSRGLEQNNIKQVRKADKKAIAILPFTDYLKGSEITPFAEGIQNDLITKLSRVDDLTVISVDSMRHVSVNSFSLKEIARTIGAGTVIKGGVQQIAGRLRLSIQLIDTKTEQIRWAETYDRVLNTENLFNIQSELAGKITGSLRTELTPSEKEQVNEKPTDNLDAYLIYTQARSHLSQRTEQAILKSLKLFREAVNKDPEYANAWAGLAESLLLLDWYGYSTPDELSDPMDAIQKALELNSELGEAYCSLGIYHSYHQNGPEANKALEKCIELQPGYSEAYNWLGWLRMIMGDPAAGLEPARRAAKLDPLSPYTRVFLAVVYLAEGNYIGALPEAKSARRLRPELGLSHFVEGLCLYHLGKYSEAEFALRESLKLEGSNGSTIKNEAYATLALAKAANGNHQEARNLLEKIKDNFCAGLVEAALNNYEEAHNLFGKVEEFGAFTTPMCRYYFPDVLEPVRKDSRFNALIKKINKSWEM